MTSLKYEWGVYATDLVPFTMCLGNDVFGALFYPCRGYGNYPGAEGELFICGRTDMTQEDHTSLDRLVFTELNKARL